ncbi:hypothetical protein MtrunA17_Chr4g0038701 [Medicago truncatula]|uniref:Transmembrane protein, putative n=1 Tax=Medicago truncatula TaxID=3880 RepID=A0A072UXL5_MEDTR|nr:transmembrane protein, putative [Medicago truncatula]RHN61627.1 hypothetical protein MtrunA17_Chr4g0038701 [Medicago truncatula]
MKTSPLLFVYIIFLTSTLVQKENLNINGDNSDDGSLPKLTCRAIRLVSRWSSGGQQANPYVWEPRRQTTLITMENNKFMVQLYQKGDLVKIFYGSPWLLDNNMIIMKKVTVGENPLTMPMKVQFYFVFVFMNLPLYVGLRVGLRSTSNIVEFWELDHVT